MERIILASGSPRRIELIAKLGLQDIEVVPSDIPEVLPEGLTPDESVVRLALQKAEAAAAIVLPGTPLIIAADTMIYLGDSLLGKPADAGEAKDMLMRLSGRRHMVYTGLVLLQNGRYISSVEKTAVVFGDMSEEEIDEYVASGEPMDKAGAYAVQGGAAGFIKSIEGDYYNIMGLPLYRLRVMLKEFAARTG